MKLKCLFAELVLLLFVGSMLVEADGQSTVTAEPLGQIKGVVFDWQDARVVNALITVEGKNTKRELASNEAGEFKIELPNGIYRIKVTHPTFRTRVIKKLKVCATQPRILSVRLRLKRASASGGNCPKGSICL